MGWRRRLLAVSYTHLYHVFDMYVPFQGATPYPASVSGSDYVLKGFTLPSVDASAARATDGKLRLALVNLDPARSAHVTTNLNGEAHGLILTGPAMDTHNTFEAPDTIHPVAFAVGNSGGKLVICLLYTSLTCHPIARCDPRARNSISTPSRAGRSWVVPTLR